MFNFHNEIAMQLSLYLREDIAKSDNKEYTADEIETGKFAEAMLYLLKTCSIKDTKFENQCISILDKAYNEIGEDTALSLYNRFLTIYQNSETKFVSQLDSNNIITTCPNCGCDITEANNALNGFCTNCTRRGLIN
ncbi:hypothetical protein [Ruminococcus sp. HUN007]|uniref:hypothetical protein n=1 Tax=Ruminococcus sp. HUN007 TaxID=1514668 RepID=UPI0005D14FA3|nr:hypothetical protein [Ruminococcus sp. HUN007]